MQLLRKVSSFIWRSVKITVLVLLILLISLFFLLQLPKVQTYLGKEASSYLSKKLKTKVDIKAVNIDFFKTINLEGVYVQDQHQDTLLYGGKIGCAIKFYSFKTRQLEIDVTELDNITCKLIYYKRTHDLNFQFIADYFAPPTTKKDTTTKPSAEFKLGYGNLNLSNVRFVYQDLDYTDIPKYGMDVEDIQVNHIFAKFSNIRIEGDSIKVQINDLSAVEKSGIRIKKLNAAATFSSKGIKADKLLLITNSSYLHGSYYMLTESFADYNHYLTAVDMRANFLDSSYVDFADIAYFAEDLEGLHQRVNINGYIKGTVNNLSSDNLSVSTLKHTSFKGHVIMKGLPNLDTTFMSIDAKNFTTNYKDLEQIPTYPFKKNKTISLPKNLAKLGTVDFKGKGEGFATDLFVKGTLTTALGSVTMHATMSQTPEKELAYGGTFKTDKFNIGSFIEAKYINEIAIDASIKGSGTELNNLQAEINGTMPFVQFNGYTYHNLAINGDLKKKQFNGTFVAKDTNATFNFVGSFDLTQKIPQAKFTADVIRLDLYKCNLYKLDSVDVASGNLSLTISGNDLDDVNGTLQAEKIQFIKSDGIIALKNIDVVLTQNATENSLQMISSVADATINGKFKLTTLQKSAGDFLHYYYPIFFDGSPKSKKSNTDNLAFKVRIKDFKPVATFFKLPLEISANTLIQGNFDAQSNLLKISGLSDQITYNKTPVKDWFLTVSTSNNQVYINTGFKQIDLTDSISVDNFNFETHSANNKSDFLLTWNNNSVHKNSGEIDGKVLFTKNSLDIDLGKFLIYAQDSLWQMTGNDEISMDSSGIVNFHDLVFTNNNQEVKIEGKISKNPKDQLLLNFQNFKLNQLNPLLVHS
ncbi:MAG: hypothetical protein ABI388_05170, partial [Bacteroidia bacterium]